MRFSDRTAAGRRLADEVRRLRLDDPVVLGLPRGGVPVAYEVARALDAPLDVIVVRKLGVPARPELGFGAIGEGGVSILNESVVMAARVGARERTAVERAERAALERRLEHYRGERPAVELVGRTALIVDDGIATGSTASAACQVARARGADRVVLAVPVAPPEALAALDRETDALVCLSSPDRLGSVGQWYDDFSQTDDAEVAELLAENARTVGHGARRDPPAVDAEVTIGAGWVGLPGHLVLPYGAPGVVVFAHGSGSSRHSPRNQAVATELNRAGLGTLLFDLLTPDEAFDRGNVFDIRLLAERLGRATAWLRHEHPVPVCYFGASTGAAAALTAAAEPDAEIAAVVSRGGRPDLAGEHLAAVRAPTLLVVGSADLQVVELNRSAAERLRCEHRLALVPGATHLFEEPGAIEAVGELARGWFLDHLPPSGTVGRGETRYDRSV
ncbi:phosphoribosyltransferase [Streptomyces hebeiensis]